MARCHPLALHRKLGAQSGFVPIGITTLVMAGLTRVPIRCHMPLPPLNVMVPRQSSDTSTPVPPSLLQRMMIGSCEGTGTRTASGR